MSATSDRKASQSGKGDKDTAVPATSEDKVASGSKTSRSNSDDTLSSVPSTSKDEWTPEQRRVLFHHRTLAKPTPHGMIGARIGKSDLACRLAWYNMRREMKRYPGEDVLADEWRVVKAALKGTRLRGSRKKNSASKKVQKQSPDRVSKPLPKPRKSTSKLRDASSSPKSSSASTEAARETSPKHKAPLSRKASPASTEAEREVCPACKASSSRKAYSAFTEVTREASPESIEAALTLLRMKYSDPQPKSMFFGPVDQPAKTKQLGLPDQLVRFRNQDGSRSDVTISPKHAARRQSWLRHMNAYFEKAPKDSDVQEPEPAVSSSKPARRSSKEIKEIMSIKNITHP